MVIPEEVKLKIVMSSNIGKSKRQLKDCMN